MFATFGTLCQSLTDSVVAVRREAGLVGRSVSYLCAVDMVSCLAYLGMRAPNDISMKGESAAVAHQCRVHVSFCLPMCSAR